MIWAGGRGWFVSVLYHTHIQCHTYFIRRGVDARRDSTAVTTSGTSLIRSPSRIDLTLEPRSRRWHWYLSVNLRRDTLVSIIRQVSSDIQYFSRVFGLVSWSPPVRGRQKECPLRMASWTGGAGYVFVSRVSVYAPYGLCRGGTPIQDSGLYCAWGPGRRYFGIEGFKFQGCSPSRTSPSGHDGSCYISSNTWSMGDDREGNLWHILQTFHRHRCRYCLITIMPIWCQQIIIEGSGD